MARGQRVKQVGVEHGVVFDARQPYTTLPKQQPKKLRVVNHLGMRYSREKGLHGVDKTGRGGNTGDPPAIGKTKTFKPAGETLLAFHRESNRHGSTLFQAPQPFTDRF